MKPKTLMLLVVAGGCGLVAMLFVQQAMKGNQGQAKVETARVLVAIADIDSGVKLTEENVTFRDLPVEGLSQDVILNPEGYADRSARIKIIAGDVVTLAKLNEPGMFGTSTQIPKGMRIKTINVDDTQSHAGLLQPGDRVDVIVTYQGKGDGNTRVTKVKNLLEFVEVFATDDRLQTKDSDGSEKGRAKNISLVVTPEQYTYVTIAESKGQLSLSWRRKDDDELVQSNNVDEELLDELEGTAGLNDPVPLYSTGDEMFGPEEPADRASNGRVPTREPRPTEPENTQQFLSSVEQADNSDDALAVNENMVTIPAEKPKWVMEVYNGNQAVPSEFEVKEEAQVEVDADTEVSAANAGGSVSDIVKKLWKGGSGSKSSAPAVP